MPIATPQGTLDFKSVDKVTFVGASSNTVIDTTTGSLGVGVGVGGPTSNLHVVGNAYVSSNLTVSGNMETKNINMLHTSNTAAIKLNSNVVTEFPRSKKLIKYPRVALTSASLNAYENGYKVTFSSDYGTDGTTWAADHVFDSDIRDATSSWASDGGLYSGGSYIGGASIGGFSGEYVHLELPVSINLSLVRMLPRTYQIPCPQAPKDYSIIASTDGVTYDLLERVTNEPDNGQFKEIHINTPKSYNRFAIVVEKTIGSDVAAISEIEYYGVPEYDPEAYGTDVVVKSDANVPNTDWLERYYDAVNYSAGTTVLDEVTATHRDATINGTVPLDTSDGIKSWSFTGNASNFILGDDIIDGISSTTSGDWVHSMSIWFKTTSMADHQNIVMILPSVNLDGSTLATGSASAFFLRRKALADGVDSRRRLQIVHWGQDVRLDYTFSENEWYNVTYTYSGRGTTSATQRVYVNGLYVPFIESTRTAATNGDNLNVNSSSRVVLGKRYYTSSPYPFNGYIANFRIFKRALSSYEAWQLYAYQKEYFGHGDLSMTLNAGRLGIGTSKPRAALDVRGNVQVRGDIHGGCPVYFHARRTSSTTASVSGTLIVWNLLELGRGGGYDPSNGKFTAPIKGVYKFIYYARGDNAANNFILRPRYNGVDPGTGNTAGTTLGNEDGAHASAYLIHEMNEGDTLEILLYTLSGTMYISSYYNGFYGYYLSSL